MKHGTVKFFNSVKGFGFIKDDETGEEVFVHVSALNGVNELNEGQKVTYKVENDPKSNKTRAADVTINN